MVWRYGPVNVFNDKEFDTEISKLDQNELNSHSNSGSRSSSNQNNNNNNRNNDNNNNEDRRNDDPQHNNNQSNRNSSRQQRGSRWAQSTADRNFRDQSKQFDKGRAKYKKKTTPSNEQLITYVNKKSGKKRRNKTKDQIEATASEICSQQSKAGRHVRQMVQEYMQDGKYGKVPKANPMTVSDCAWCSSTA